MVTAPETHIKFQSENLKERNHLRQVCINGMLIFKWILSKVDVKLRTGFIWFRIGTSGGIL
jgi:hypothetical protein